MAISASFIDHAEALFAPFGKIRIRKMFGGAGVYCDDLFFALLDDDRVFLKVDDETRGAFEARGLEPFRFESNDGETLEMSGYFAAPDDIFDDDDELRRWTTMALDAARRAAKFRKKKPARKAASTKASPAAARKRR